MSRDLRVLIAEPDEPTRVGIRLVLQDAGFDICSEPLDASSTVASAIAERPDACLIDEGLRGGSIVAVDGIFRRMPATRLLLLTAAEEPKAMFQAIRAGASGFVRKDADPARLPATIRGVIAGEAALSRRLAFHLMESLRTRERGRAAPTTPGGPSMTDRELEVLELMTEGLRTSEIAARLSIAEVTVRRHVSSAVAKLGVNDRDAAIGILTGRSRV